MEITQKQLDEYQVAIKEVVAGFAQVKNLPEELKGLTNRIELLKTLPEEQKRIVGELAKAHEDIGEIKKQLDAETKRRITTPQQRDILRPGQFVDDECAKFLGAMLIKEGFRKERFKEMDAGKRAGLLDMSCDILGITDKTTLSSSDIPLPVNYGSQVVELVWKYGQARKYGTAYPLGTSQTKLPRLKTSPAFGLIAQAGTVTEKSPQFEWVTFTLAKWGGLVRFPNEIDQDSIVALGQFIADYGAREMAKIEDVVFFTADGTATYNSLSGLLKQAIALSNGITQAAGKTAPGDVTLQNLRDMRTLIASAAIDEAAYYAHRTFESKFVTFNTIGDSKIYIPGATPTLDGFPVRWVDVLPANSTTASVSTPTLGFGAARFHYMGNRPGIMIDQSKEVFFATDEIGTRFLERFTTGLMADEAFAAIQTAAA